jgi:hypothetical protein
MKKSTCWRPFRDALSQFLTPQVWKQAHQAWPEGRCPSRWKLLPLVSVLLGMTWCCGDSQDERFATARAVYVARRSKVRRPGESLQGFLKALAQLPMLVLRALARALRQRLGEIFLDGLRINGFVPMACDGSRLECPRSEELQARMGQASRAHSPPLMYLTTLVLLPLGLVWSWRWGKGDASELHHLRQLLPTLPKNALIIADAYYLGYELYTAIMQAGASFLMRMSSRAYLYTLDHVSLQCFREGLVYFWPQKAQKANKPPLLVRLLRVRGQKEDVWLLTNVLDTEKLSHKRAAQLYRWRWRNEGLFRHYKRMLKKVKLYSRTVALVHREAEGAMLALQLLLALTAQNWRAGKDTVLVADSPRHVLLRIRGDMTALLRTLGPRQFTKYQQLLAVVRCQIRQRLTPKTRQVWPRNGDKHKPPGFPKIRVLPDKLKTRLAKLLRAA